MKKLLSTILAVIFTTGVMLALEPGQKAPDIMLPNHKAKMTNLSDYHGKNVVLAFVPGAFSQICTDEFCQFRDMEDELNNLDAQVIGISVDSPLANAAWVKENKINFPVLSDFDHKVIGNYDVKMQDFYGIKDMTVANRAIFIVDGDGIVRYKWVADDPSTMPPFDEIKDTLASLD